jgi:hypothetical protein
MTMYWSICSIKFNLESLGYEDAGRIQLAYKVCHRVLAAEVLVQFQAILCGICDRQIDAGTQTLLVFLPA